MSTFCRCWDPYSTLAPQEDFFVFSSNNIVSCCHPMDKRNNSASAEDITETRNSSQNLEVRILRSRPAKKPPADSMDTLVKPTAKRIRRKRPTESGPEHELSKIRKQIKYFFNRISYHQTFLEAYTRKGWKNQRFATSLFMYLIWFAGDFSWTHLCVCSWTFIHCYSFHSIL
jgi:hypothetical protein